MSKRTRRTTRTRWRRRRKGDEQVGGEEEGEVPKSVGADDVAHALHPDEGQQETPEVVKAHLVVAPAVQAQKATLCGHLDFGCLHLGQTVEDGSINHQERQGGESGIYLHLLIIQLLTLAHPVPPLLHLILILLLSLIFHKAHLLHLFRYLQDVFFINVALVSSRHVGWSQVKRFVDFPAERIRIC